MTTFFQDEVTTTEIVKKIHKMVLEDHRLKLRELAGCAQDGHKDDGKMLTKEQKQCREDDLRRRSSQNNRLIGENRLQIRQGQFHLLARSWHQVFGMHVELF